MPARVVIRLPEEKTPPAEAFKSEGTRPLWDSLFTCVKTDLKLRDILGIVYKL